MDSSTISASQHDYSFHLRTKCNRKLKAYNILEPPTRGRDLLTSSISKSNKSKEGNHLIELMMGKKDLQWPILSIPDNASEKFYN